MRLSTLLLSGLLPADALAAIKLRAFSGKGCDGDKVIKLSLVNAGQCNNFSNPPKVYSARASGLDGCIVTLYKTQGCTPADGAELFLDEDNECDDATPAFRARSYDVSC